MTARRIILPIALLGALSGPVSAAPDAAPVAAETAKDAGAPSEADDTPNVPVNPAEEDPIDIGKDIYKAIKGGNWLLAAALAGMFLAWFAKLLIGYLKPSWASSKIGRYAISFGTIFLIVLGAGPSQGVPLSWSLLAGAAATALSASGIYNLIQDARKAKA